MKIKDASSSSATTDGTGGSRSVGGSSTVVSSFNATKRETLMLPHFSGEEKTAYLKYPICKQQWESHITEYEEKDRATMLMNHLDEKAQL